MIRQKFEDNLRILANFGKFSRQNSKIYGFRPYVFKKLQSLSLYYLIKIILFTLKSIHSTQKLRSKHFVKERCKKFRKNQFFSNIFTFLSVTLQNFENNLRILANLGKFSHKNLKIYGFRPYIFKKLQFFFFLIKIILSAL